VAVDNYEFGTEGAEYQQKATEHNSRCGSDRTDVALSPTWGSLVFGHPLWPSKILIIVLERTIRYPPSHQPVPTERHPAHH